MTAVRGHQLLIDWSNAGTFLGPLEDVTNHVDRGPITVSWGRPTDSASMTTPTAEMAFTLLNRRREWDRWFSPENAASPIYGRIHPGKQVRLTRTVGGVTEPRTDTWAAAVGAWQPTSGGGTLARVAAPSEDGNGALRYTPPGAVAVTGFITTDGIDLTTRAPGQVIVTFRVQASATWPDVAAVIDWYDVAGAFISTSGLAGATTTPAGVWTTVQSAPLTPPAAATSGRPRLRIGSTPPNTTLFYADSMSATWYPNDADRTYLLHAGVLDDLDVDSTAVARTFSGVSKDPTGRPDAQPLSTPVLQGKRTGELVGYVLDQMGWTGDRAIDPGLTVVPYWWEEGTDPLAAIDKLVLSEGPPAIAYREANTFVFRDRHHRTRSAASTTSQGTFSHVWPPGPRATLDYKIEAGTFAYEHGLKNIINAARFSVPVLAAQAPAEIWMSEDPVSLSSGETQVFSAEPGDPAINIGAPEIQTLGGTFVVTVDRTSGKKFLISVTCTANGTISRMALRGNSITTVRTVQVGSTDAASVGKYGGTTVWPNEAPWAGQYDAAAIADRVVAMYGDALPRVSFTIANINDRHLTEILTLRIGDRITIRNDVLGVLRDFYVERLEHEISRLLIHRVRVHCVAVEPVQPANAFTFNVAGRGFNDGAFAVPGIDSAGSIFLFNSASQGFNAGQFAT